MLYSRVVWILCVALTVCGTTAAAVKPPTSVADFVRRPQFNKPLLSPDGEHLIVSRIVQLNGRDTTVMVVYALADMKVVSMVRLPVFELPAGYTWITNKRVAVTTARESGTLEAPELTGEIMAMDLDGRNQLYLYGYQTRIGPGRVPIPADRGWGSVNFVPESLNGRFFLSENGYGVRENRSQLYDVDSTTAARRQVAEIEMQNFEFLVQHDGKPRFAYGTDKDNEPSLFEYEDKRGDWQEVRRDDKVKVFPIALSADDTEIFGMVSFNRGPSALVRQPLAGGDRKMLARDKVGSIDIFERGPRSEIPFAAGTLVGIPKLQYFDGERPEAKLHQALSAQFPGSYVHFINFSQDGGKLLFSVISDRDPGAYYLYDRSVNKAFLLFALRPWIDPEGMAEQQPFHFTASDGMEIHGYLTMPPTAGVNKPPLILLPHGGPHGVADDWSFDTDAQFLASRGYAVLRVNYRGSSGRGRAFEAAGYRQWGGRVQQDLIDAVRWTVSQGKVDGQRICVYGGSFGAYSAMMTAIRAPDLFKCAVGYAGLYDLAKLYETDAAVASKKVFNYWVKVIGQDPAELANNSPTKLAEKLTVPVLLVHGSADTRTPPIQAKLMREALTKAGRPPEWMYVEDEGHGFYAEKSRQAFYEKLESFLAKHLAK